MFSALKMAWHLGSHRVYLLGCDFAMRDDSVYAFDEGKTAGAVKSNNNSYRKIAKLLELAKPHFDAMGFEVYNCNPHSQLDLYPHVEFRSAVEQATEGIEQVPDTTGWYHKK